MKHADGITFGQKLAFIFISVAFLKTELVTDFISHNTNFLKAMQLPLSFQYALSFFHGGAFECDSPFEYEGTGNYASLLPILGALYKFKSLDLIDLHQCGEDYPN